jgi:hypothetical protein
MSDVSPNCEPKRTSTARSDFGIHDKTIQSVDDGDKTNSSPGRARSKPFKPLRREGRTVSAEPVVTPPVHFFRTGDRGCGERPVFPAPSAFRGARDGITPGAIRAAGRRSHIC